MIGDPDPFTAAMNAVGYFHISEIVISTLPGDRVGVGRGRAGRARREGDGQAGRARRRRATGDGGGLMEAGALAAGPHRGPRDEHEHHGPPPANRSSRVEPPMLGMLLFIISEIMVFGAFFTAYFFIRVVAGRRVAGRGHRAAEARSPASTRRSWSPRRSRCTGRETALKADNRFGLQAGIFTTFLLGATFLFIQINEYVHIGFSPQDSAQGSIFYGLTGPARRARLHRPDAAGHGDHPRLPRPLHARRSTAASRCRASTGTSSTSCGSSST